MGRMRRMTTWAAALAAACSLALASPADALDIPPIDTTRSGLAFDLGATSVGGLLSIGPLRVGTAAYVAALPGVGRLSGLSASLACRLSPRSAEGSAWGAGVTGYAVSGLPFLSSAPEGLALYPALIGTLPLGDDLVLRASGGPVFFTGQSDWTAVGAGQRVMRGVTGFMPFVPNLQIVLRMDDGSEMTLGGFPSIVGWRVAL